MVRQTIDAGVAPNFASPQLNSTNGRTVQNRCRHVAACCPMHFDSVVSVNLRGSRLRTRVKSAESESDYPFG